MYGSRYSGFLFSYNEIMDYGIREHALYYALLAKAVLETEHLPNAEALLETITFEYGRRRGKRMRANAETLCPSDDLSAFFRTGEWAGKPGENRSELIRNQDTTESHVHVCAWYDTWKKTVCLHMARITAGGSTLRLRKDLTAALRCRSRKPRAPEIPSAGLSGISRSVLCRTSVRSFSPFRFISKNCVIPHRRFCTGPCLNRRKIS